MKALLLIFLLSPSFAMAQDPSFRGQELVGLRTLHPGPNCWNAALYAAGLVGGIRHMIAEEFTAWLESPLCQKVSAEEAVAGDIVAFRRSNASGRLVDGPFGSEIHGFILAGANQAFTKNGALVAHEFRLQDIGSLRDQYERTNRSECRMMDFPRGQCHLKAEHFRCSPQSVKVSAEVRAFEIELSSLESQLHRFYLGADVSLEPLAVKAAIRARIAEMEKTLRTLTECPAENPAWWLEILRLRLKSAAVFSAS